MTLSTQVLIGLVLGVLAGVGFGEETAFLAVVGRSFVMLLQMTVLPFVALSLITGLGGLAPRGARALVRYAGGFLLVVWFLTLAVVLLAPVAFPNWSAASFFSSSLVEERERFDFIGVYIPANPFRSLSDGIVPAVVVFSIGFGIALMGSTRKASLLESLLAAQDAIRSLTRAVLRLAPLGIFAIAAEATGTTSLDKLAGLQVYAVTYVAMSLLLAFWVLPLLVAAVTPLTYREVLGPARDALLTAFATGSVFVVLPILADRCKEVLAERGASEDARRLVDVVVPISFTLAGSAKLLGLVFVLFAGWLSGFPIPPSDYPELVLTGIFSCFASSAVALPFLLDLFRIPSDTFQLYLIADHVIVGRFGAMLASVHTLSLAFLAACGTCGWVAIRRRELLLWAIGSVALTLLALGAIRVGFGQVELPYAGYRNFIGRSFLLPTVPWSDRDGPPEGAPEGWGGDALTRAAARGSLRVGYARDRLPYAFRNEAGALVGFDVEMAHALARDLGVRVEFYRVEIDRMPDLLDSGAVDVLMTGLAITPERLKQMAFSRPYLEETFAFIVRDYRRKEFGTRAALEAAGPLRVAVPGRGYYAGKVRAYAPDAETVVVDSPRAFFKAPDGEFDALAYAAEAGSAWTLIYPQFTVAVPQPDVLNVPLGYAVARSDRKTADFLDSWILLKMRDRTIDRLFRYWFEGVDPPGRSHRWSFVADVLGWGRGSEEAAPQAAPGAPVAPPAPEAPAPAAPAAPGDGSETREQAPGEPGGATPGGAPGAQESSTSAATRSSR